LLLELAGVAGFLVGPEELLRRAVFVLSLVAVRE